jgi:hypothetical protein
MQKLKHWIGCFYYKYELERKSNSTYFEKDFCYKLKMYLVANFPSCYWNFVLSPKIGYRLSNQHDYMDTNSSFELHLGFAEFEAKSTKPVLLVFQRRGKMEMLKCNKK